MMNPVLSRAQRVLLISLVALLHGMLLVQWQPTPQREVVHEISASLLLTEVAPMLNTPPAPPPHATNTAHPSRTVVPPNVPAQTVATPLPASAQATTQATANSTPSPTPSANLTVAEPTVPPDREPDYQAAYLNNPKPPYPAMAAHMGWQGKVIIRVEVLATGLAGQVSVQHSSGHEVLDNAALQAVRNWQFLPARQNGQLVSKHFLIPIPFTLKDSDE